MSASPGVSRRDIARVLAGEGDYDELSEPEQAIVRATWRERIADRREALDFEAELLAAGDPWAEADAQGNLIVRHA